MTRTSSTERAERPGGAERSADGSVRPQRADAQRNRATLVAAAREVFTERGSEASLEEIARRAGVGVGTLYRHFPTRQALIEAVYVEEVEALCRSAADAVDGSSWDALVRWFNRFVDYVATKKALVEEMMATIGQDAQVFRDLPRRDLHRRPTAARAGEERRHRPARCGVHRRDPHGRRDHDDAQRDARRRSARPGHGARRAALSGPRCRRPDRPAPAPSGERRCRAADRAPAAALRNR